MSSIKNQSKSKFYLNLNGGIMSNLIWTFAGVLFILWLLGFSINIGGGLIHLLLVLALIAIVYNLVTGRSIG
jgi:hypothetical protein